MSTSPPFVFASRRSPVYGAAGAAASSQPAATRAGLAMLEAGGNAADAAVAMAAALAVAEPCSTGLGGDAFALFYDAATGSTDALNGSGRSAAALTLQHIIDQGLAGGLPPEHGLAVTVPGACAAWCDLLQRHGSLPLGQVLSPAIELAEGGLAMAPLTAELWGRSEAQLASTTGGHQLLIDGRAPVAGQVFRNAGLAGVLRKMALAGPEGSKDLFYCGKIARAIVKTTRSIGGLLAEDDLAAHQSEWTTPIETDWAGLRVQECPPNGQGIVTLIALNILKHLEWFPTGEPLSAAALHGQIEALRLAFAQAHRYLADPECAAQRDGVPVAELLADGHAADLARRIDPGRAARDIPLGFPLAHSETVYFCAVDARGNACSMVNSNYLGFGTGAAPEGLGFTLHNRGLNFSLADGHPNAAGPRQRPYHTIIPGMLVRQDGGLYAPFGVMGAYMQPQGHLQVLLQLTAGADPQAALDAPRFCIEDGRPDGVIQTEEGMDEQTARTLEDMGHAIQWVRGTARSVFGRGQVIVREPATGVVCAGSDPRADGCALALQHATTN